jgi:hypothetical protein
MVIYQAIVIFDVGAILHMHSAPTAGDDKERRIILCLGRVTAAAAGDREGRG